MCASNYAALEFENYWDRDIAKLPFYRRKCIERLLCICKGLTPYVFIYFA